MRKHCGTSKALVRLRRAERESDLHRIGKTKDAESIRYSHALDRASMVLPETRSTHGRRQLQKARRGGRDPNRKTSAASAQDGKAERTAASGRFGAAVLSLRHAAALRYGSLCAAGA